MASFLPVSSLNPVTFNVLALSYHCIVLDFDVFLSNNVLVLLLCKQDKRTH